MNFLSKVSVKYQINVVSLLALAGLAVIAAGFFLANRTQEHSLEMTSRIVKRVDSLRATEGLVLEARIAAADFAERPSEELANAAEAKFTAAEATIATLRGLVIHPDEIKEIEQFAKVLSATHEAFRAVLEITRSVSLDEKSGLLGGLRKAVHGVEEVLGEVKESLGDHLMVQMLQMRRDEKDFITRRDPKYIKQLASRQEDFTKVLAATSLPDEQKRRIASLMSDYGKQFGAFADGVLKLGTRIVEFRTVYQRDLMPATNALVEDALKDRATIAAEADAEMDSAFRALMWTMLLSAVAIVGGGLGIGRAIAGPILRVTDVMRQVSEGNTAIDIPGRERADEIGAMANTLQVFKDNLVHMEQLRQGQMKEAEAKIRRQEAANQLIQDFSGSVSGVLKSLAAAATEMEATANSMSAMAERTGDQAETVAENTRQASGNVEMVAEATSQLSSTVTEISQQVSQASRIAQNAVNEAERTNSSINGLAESAQRIGEVVSLINDIASQTNLLALNATIEAARAGDAGKGFAVVANEVKNLANQTAKATGEIGTQISAVQDATREAVSAIQGISRIIGQINDITTAIAAAVEEQSASTQEIARNIGQATDGTRQVSITIGAVTEAVGETGTAAREVLAASGEVSRQAEGLRAEVETFLVAIKGAGERRQYQRMPVSMAGAVVVGGTSRPCRLRDISLGGASIDLRLSQAIGSQVRFSVDGLNGDMLVRISEISADGSHFQFPLDASTRDRLTEFLTGLEQRQQNRAG